MNKFYSISLVLIVFLFLVSLSSCGDDNTVITPTSTPQPTSTPGGGTLEVQGEILNTNGITNDLNAIQFVDVDTGYAVGEQQIVLKTTDGGDTWTQVNGTELTSSKGTGLLPNANDVGFVDVDTGFIISDNNSIKKTTDGGKTWDYPTYPFVTPGTNYLALGLPGCPLSSDFFIQGVKEDDNNGTVILTSDDLGDTWTQVSSDLPVNSSKTSCILASDGVLWIVVDGKIYKSTDGGKTSTLDEQASSMGNFVDIGINPDDANSIMAVGSTVIYTNDGGQNWNESTDLGDRPFSDITTGVIDDSSSWVYIRSDPQTSTRTDSAGIYTNSLGEYDFKDVNVKVSDDKISGSAAEYKSSTALMDGNELVVYLIGNDGLIVRGRINIADIITP